MCWGSRVLMWVESSDGRKFRHSSGVPTPHNVTVTLLPLAQCKSYRMCPVCYDNSYKTASFFQGGYKYPQASTFGGCWFCWSSLTFWALQTRSNPLLVSDWSNSPNPFVGWEKFKKESKLPLEHLCLLSISWFAFVTLGLFGPRWLGERLWCASESL